MKKGGFVKSSVCVFILLWIRKGYFVCFLFILVVFWMYFLGFCLVLVCDVYFGKFLGWVGYDVVFWGGNG